MKLPAMASDEASRCGKTRAVAVVLGCGSVDYPASMLGDVAELTLMSENGYLIACGSTTWKGRLMEGRVARLSFRNSFSK